jgi:hypothetical protein
LDFQNNEKTMEHSDHWIMTGWHGEQWDFQNNETSLVLLDGMENSGIFKTMEDNGTF